MTNYVLLKLAFEGYSRSVYESEIMTQEVYEKHQEEIDSALDSVWWGDFDGKHGHVYADYSTEYLTEEQALEYIQSKAFQEEDLDKGWDILTDEIDSEICDELIASMNLAIRELKGKVSTFSLKIDLSNIEDKEAEKLKIQKFLSDNGYNFSLI